jgi:hypothetical protein
MWKKLAWFIALWAAGVISLAGLAYGLKILMEAAGLSD